MAEKGARLQLEGVARQMFLDGKSLTEIAETINVSRQTLTDWKSRAGDEWDKARERKNSFGIRMEALLDRELHYAECRQAGAVEGGTLDNLSKLGALVVKFKTVEAVGGYDKPKVFLENLQWLITWLKENQPEGLKVLAVVFDELTEAYKAEHGGA